MKSLEIKGLYKTSRIPVKELTKIQWKQFPLTPKATAVANRGSALNTLVIAAAMTNMYNILMLIKPSTDMLNTNKVDFFTF